MTSPVVEHVGGAPRRVQPRPFTYVVITVVGVLLAGLLVPYTRVAATRTTTNDAAGTLGGGSQTLSGPGQSTEGGTDAGSSSSGGGAGQPGSAQGGGGGSVASGGGSDVGVTATEIHVGIGILDIGAAKQFGFNFDIGDQRARYDALIASVNKRGGINGRKVVPHYRVIEVSKQESFQAACISWTKDDKVFAVFLSSQTPQAASVCIIGEGNTPFITSDGIDDSYYANGNYFSVQPNDNRVLHDQALYLLAKGVLKGKTVGVLTGDGAERLAIDRTLIPELARGGIKVAAVEVVPADTSGTQKMPIAVSNFKDAGVDYVIIAANVILAGPFVQSADRSGLKAEYGLSDFNNQINDQVADYYPDSFDGTVGLSTHRFSEYRAGSPPPPADKACLDIVHPVDPKVQPSTNSAFEVAMMECAMWTMFVAGVTRAGAALNRGSFRAGVEQIGPTPIAGILDGSYGPGKHDGGNTVREVAWHKSCSCWQIAGPLRPMR